MDIRLFLKRKNGNQFEKQNKIESNLNHENDIGFDVSKKKIKKKKDYKRLRNSNIKFSK